MWPVQLYGHNIIGDKQRSDKPPMVSLVVAVSMYVYIYTVDTAKDTAGTTAVHMFPGLFSCRKGRFVIQ